MRALPLLALLAACGGPGFGGSYLVYVRNAQGSVAAAVDEHGAKVWETHDDAYGLRLASTGTPVPREFLDQPLDEETGFYQFHYRTYDPASAQWLQPDPKLQLQPDACASQPEYCDPYAYAGDRPGEWIDPDGQWVQNNVLINGELCTVATIAVVGPNRESAAASLENAIQASNATPGNQKVQAVIKTYDDPADVPKSYTRIDADYLNDGKSTTDRTTSTIHLRSDALTAKDGQLGRMVLHELLHAAGADDGYFESLDALGNRQTAPLAGREEDIMATLAGKVISDIDLGQMIGRQTNGELNQGLQAPAPGEWPYPSDPTDTSATPAAASSGNPR